MKGKRTKHINITIPIVLADDQDLKLKIYSIFGRAGLSGLMTYAMMRIKEKGKL